MRIGFEDDRTSTTLAVTSYAVVERGRAIFVWFEP